VAKSQQLRDEEISLANRAIALAADASALATRAVEALQQQQDLELQAADLQVEAANLQTEAARLETDAANLQTEQVEAQGLQQQALTDQEQAEQLKAELTEELTKAGGDERGTDPRLVALQDALAEPQSVAAVSPPNINESGKAATFSVIATTAPADDETADLVGTLRTYTIPQATAGTDVEAFVGGRTASYVDLAEAISDRLLLVILAVVALGFLVLVTAYRSFVAAVQAAVANVLSVCAAFGVLTAFFQWGWGLSLVGLDTASGTSPIVSYVPLMMFAVLFGLSMDYQVFLLSLVEHHRTAREGDRSAVAAGLASGARVITAAALIMIAVFGSFVLSGDPTVKQFGVGLSVGVAFAAVTVLLLAPALLVLAGSGSWWLPAWMDRLLPHVDVEGTSAARARETEPVEAPPAPAT
jgi:uncharacterized membrane protein YdfJ with MMPL/SSD domain